MKYIIYGFNKIIAIADTLTELDFWITKLLSTVSLDNLTYCTIYKFNSDKQIIAEKPVMEYVKEYKLNS